MGALLGLLGSGGLTAITGLFTNIIDRISPDPTIAAQLKAKLLDQANQQALQQMINENDQFKSAAAIVLAEANSSSWLTKNWRPLTMLSFVILIGAHWFGWNATNLSPAEYADIYALVKIGLGGYVIGRTAEKIAPSVVTAIKGAS